MAPTRQKALSSVLTRKHVATQTELPQKHAATQLSGCQECLNLALAGEGSSETGCLRCDQVDDLLSLVAELHEEVERLRSIREAERDIDWWSQALPSPRQKQGQLTDQSQSEGDPVSSPRQAESSSLKEGSEWKQVHARRGRWRTFSSSATSPSHVPLCNRYEALAVEGHSSEDMDDSQATAEVAPRPKRPVPRVMTTPTKKKRRVIVVGDSLLKAHSKPRGDEPGAPDATGTNGVTLGRYIKRIPATPANKSASLGAQLKCLYVNTRSVGNKQEELETCVSLQGYDLIGITETWWDSSYDWSVGMEGYRLFRKDRQGRRGGGIALYVSDQLECMELHLGMEEELTKSLWVRIKGRAGAGDVIAGVCYRPPDQGD
ncbi:hypothetical protein GRJ2_001010500 [Grus japonensis]|uniref:Uncharacterized protein n=1 Tax=Grus japonensis TaxID=30415 RepID=A0ABC9WM67_GRUJA